MHIPVAVLVVEDDPTIQQLLTTVVLRHSFTPILAGDGKTAIVELARRAYGAILLDFLLPEENGFEVLRHIACTQPMLLARVIVITAAPDSLWRDCPYLDRIHAVVRKPFDVNRLEHEMVACCDGS